MSDFLKRILHLASTLAGANVCEVCGSPLPEGQQVICPGCLMTLNRTDYHRYRTNPVSDLISNAVAPIALATSWFFYNPSDPYANLIRHSKYYNRPAHMRELGRLYASELMADAPDIMDFIDVMLPVPMHPLKELDRGFNQAVELARGIGDVTGIRVGDNLTVLRRKGTQTRRNYGERHSNVEGVFGVVHPEELDGLNVMVVDDVITTGATVSEVALTIGKAGCRPASLSVLSLALRRTP